MTTKCLSLTLSGLLVFAGPCLALWEIAPVSKERAKELGIEVRSQPAGPDAVRVELDVPTDGVFRDFERVELRIGERGNSGVSAPLREERPKQGRCVVSFSADRNQLDKLTLWVYVRGALGGVIYELRVSEFVDAAKGP